MSVEKTHLRHQHEQHEQPAEGFEGARLRAPVVCFHAAPETKDTQFNYRKKIIGKMVISQKTIKSVYGICMKARVCFIFLGRPVCQQSVIHLDRDSHRPAASWN